MQKTKFGITTGMYAALTFLSGLVSYLVVIIMAGYALLFEEDQTLKKNALKAVLFILAIAVASALLTSLNSVISFINTFVGSIFNEPFNLRIPFSLPSLLSNLIVIVEKLGLIIFAFNASKNLPINIPVANNYAENEFKNE